MDVEMIERVAKAILETPNASDYETLVARNAIRAMREPTDKINSINVGSIHWSTDEIWQMFIDAIIND